MCSSVSTVSGRNSIIGALSCEESLTPGAMELNRSSCVSSRVSEAAADDEGAGSPVPFCDRNLSSVPDVKGGLCWPIFTILQAQNRHKVPRILAALLRMETEQDE